jgi:hypothetical protein
MEEPCVTGGRARFRSVGLPPLRPGHIEDAGEWPGFGSSADIDRWRKSVEGRYVPVEGLAVAYRRDGRRRDHCRNQGAWIRVPSDRQSEVLSAQHNITSGVVAVPCCPCRQQHCAVVLLDAFLLRLRTGSHLLLPHGGDAERTRQRKRQWPPARASCTR